MISLPRKFHTHTINSHRGFSLVEVLVSLSIFIIVVTICVGALMSLISANARARNTQAVMTNISYALDSMTREMRTGTDYDCEPASDLSTGVSVDTSDCTNGTALSFNEGGRSITKGLSSKRIAYRFANNAIERRLADGNWLPVTAPEVKITKLRFYTTGSTRNDAGNLAPQITIYIEGTAGDDVSEQGQFNVQTTVTQQLLDI